METKIGQPGFKYFQVQHDYEELITPIELQTGEVVYQAAKFVYDTTDGFVCTENKLLDEEAYEISLGDFSYKDQGHIWYESTRAIKRHIYTYEREAEHDYLGLQTDYQANKNLFSDGVNFDATDVLYSYATKL